MLKEKDAEIEKYKQLYYILSRQNARIEHDNMEKDKMIDLMSEELIGHIFEDAYVKFDEEDIKQYFERKAEQSSSINKTPEKN